MDRLLFEVLIGPKVFPGFGARTRFGRRRAPSSSSAVFRWWQWHMKPRCIGFGNIQRTSGLHLGAALHLFGAGMNHALSSTRCRFLLFLYISARLARITENLRGWLARGPTCQHWAFQDGLGSTGCAMWGLCPKSAAISIQRSSARTPRAVFVRSLRLLMGRRSARLWPSPCWPPRPLLRRSPRGGGSLQMRPWMEQFSRVAIRRLPRVSCCNLGAQ